MLRNRWILGAHLLVPICQSSAFWPWAHGKMGFLGGSMLKNLPASAGGMSSTHDPGRFPWKRKWQPTPVVLPGNSMTKESGRLHCPWGRKETDMTQRLSMYTPCMRAARLCVVLVREFSLSRWQSTAVEQRSQVTAHSLFLYNPWGKDGFHNFNWLKKKSKDECYFVTHKNDIKFRFHCP